MNIEGNEHVVTNRNQYAHVTSERGGGGPPTKLAQKGVGKRWDRSTPAGRILAEQPRELAKGSVGTTLMKVGSRERLSRTLFSTPVVKIVHLRVNQVHT